MAAEQEQQGASIHLPDELPECSNVHWMPFGIDYDGPVSTSAHFQPRLQEAADAVATPSNSSSSSQQWEAHFRGRQLKGTLKALLEGFQGLVLKPTGHNSSSTSTSDAQQRSWQAVGRVTQLVLWGHDVAPAAADPHMRCIDWLALADHVHQPVNVSAVDEELERMKQQGLVA